MYCRLLTRHWTHVWFPLRRNKIRSFYEIYCCMADRDSFASRLDGTSICADARTYADGYVGYAAGSPVGILMELEKQTGLFFSYESSLLKRAARGFLSVRDESLSYCLKRLFSPLPIIYRVTGQYIILKRKPPSIYDQRIRQGFSLV